MRRDIKHVHYSRLSHLLRLLREAPEEEKLYWRYRILKMRVHITTEEFVELRMKGLIPLSTSMCMSCKDIYSPIQRIHPMPFRLGRDDNNTTTKICERCYHLYTFEELPNVKDNLGNAVYIRRVRSVRK